jgi:hypothetical protein
MIFHHLVAKEKSMIYYQQAWEIQPTGTEARSTTECPLRPKMAMHHTRPN